MCNQFSDIYNDKQTFRNTFQIIKFNSWNLFWKHCINTGHILVNTNNTDLLLGCIMNCTSRIISKSISRIDSFKFRSFHIIFKNGLQYSCLYFISYIFLQQKKKNIFVIILYCISAFERKYLFFLNLNW